MKLQAKISLLLLPLVAIPLLAVGVAAYLQLTDVSRQRSQQQIHTLFNMYQSQIDNIARTAQSNLHLFSDYPLIKQYFLAETEEERYLVLYLPVQRQLHTIQKNYPEYYELRLLLPDGFEDLRMINRPLPNISEMELDSPLFSDLLAFENNMLTRVDRNPDNKELALYVTKRVVMINDAIEDFGATPRLRGYFGITADIDFLLRQLEESILGNKSGMLLTDDRGDILYLPSHLEGLNGDLNGLFAENLFTAGKLVQLPSGGYQISSQHLQNNLWVHALMAEQDLQDSSRSLSRTIAWITLIALAASLSLIFLGLNMQVIGPLTRLRKGILELSDGNELVQIPIHSRDELGDLAQEFNRMGLALQRSNEQIRSMAYSDYLTELPNRFHFHKTLTQAMDVALRKNRQLGLIFIDLDNFKNINDTLGHQTGDRLLKDIAHRLQNNLRGIDVSGAVELTPQEHNIARLGGMSLPSLSRDSPR
jgi:HAMP domain-containing protein